MGGWDLEVLEFEASWGYTWVQASLGSILRICLKTKWKEEHQFIEVPIDSENYKDLLKYQLFCYYIWNAKELKYQRKQRHMHHSSEIEVQYMINYVTREHVIIIVHYTNSSWFLRTSVNSNLPWEDSIHWELRTWFLGKLQTSVIIYISVLWI